MGSGDLVRNSVLLPVCPVLLALAACAPTVERIHVRLSDNLNMDAGGTLSLPVESSDNSSAVTALETCLGSKVRHLTDGGRHYYSVERVSIAPGDLNDLRRCLLRTNWVGADVSRSEGLLSTTYNLTLRLFELGRSPTEESDRKGQLLPSLVNVEMPGGAISVKDISPRQVAALDVEKISSTHASISIRVAPDILHKAYAERRKLCPQGSTSCLARSQAEDNGRWPAVIPVMLHIESTEYKYGPNELIALAALLFGSGLAIGTGKWVRSRSAR